MTRIKYCVLINYTHRTNLGGNVNNMKTRRHHNNKGLKGRYTASWTLKKICKKLI